MQAITTKFLGPTNARGSRIKASAYAGSITIEYAHELNSDENHRAAAVALCEKIGWIGADTLISACLPKSGYVFVFSPNA